MKEVSNNLREFGVVLGAALLCRNGASSHLLSLDRAEYSYKAMEDYLHFGDKVLRSGEFAKYQPMFELISRVIMGDILAISNPAQVEVSR